MVLETRIVRQNHGKETGMANQEEKWDQNDRKYVSKIQHFDKERLICYLQILNSKANKCYKCFTDMTKSKGRNLSSSSSFSPTPSLTEVGVRELGRPPGNRHLPLRIGKRVGKSKMKINRIILDICFWILWNTHNF